MRNGGSNHAIPLSSCGPQFANGGFYDADQLGCSLHPGVGSRLYPVRNGRITHVTLLSSCGFYFADGGLHDGIQSGYSLQTGGGGSVVHSLQTRGGSSTVPPYGYTRCEIAVHPSTFESGDGCTSPSAHTDHSNTPSPRDVVGSTTLC